MSQPNEKDSTLRNDAMLRQLNELNARSRWYSSQLWQTPFAYLVICGIIMSAGGRVLSLTPYLLLFCAICGVFLRFHLRAIRDAQRRSVDHLIALEQRLGLEPTAQHGEGKTSKSTPLMSMVDCLIVAFLIVAIALGIYVLFFYDPTQGLAAPNTPSRS